MHAVAVWACEPSHADADIRTQQRADILGHRFRDLIAHRALFLDERRVNAQQLRLGLVRVGHNAALEKRARSGHIGKALCNLSAGAALRSGEGHALFTQQLYYALLDALDVHAVDHIAEALYHVLHHGGDHFLGLVHALCLCGYLEQAVALLGVGRHGGVRHAVHFLGKDIVDGAFAETEDAHRVRYDKLLRELAQIRQRALAEHGVALLGRAGDHDDDLAVLLKAAAGRGAAVVVKHRAALREHGLREIIVGELLAVADIVVQPLALGLVLGELEAESLGKDLLCEVVTGGAEAAGRDDDVRAALSRLNTLTQPLRVIADDGVVLHVYADLREHLGNVPRVGIRHVAEQQLSADGDYLSIVALTHGPALSFRSPQAPRRRARRYPASTPRVRPRLSSGASSGGAG